MFGEMVQWVEVFVDKHDQPERFFKIIYLLRQGLTMKLWLAWNSPSL